MAGRKRDGWFEWEIGESSHESEWGMWVKRDKEDMEQTVLTLTENEDQ